MSVIKYQAHCSDIGWQDPVADGQIAGTVGQCRPLECFRVTEINIPGVGIHGFAHVQDIGWSAGNIQTEDIGSTGLGKFIEAVKIGLFGENADKYDIFYRLHIQDKGFLNWSKNGELNGTVGGNIQAEAIQIEVHQKSDTKEAFFDLTPKTNLPEQVIEHARSWLGYTAGTNNVFGYDNYCIAFVCACMKNVGIDFINTAWCDDAKYWAKEKGIWIDDPYAGQPGYPIAFDFKPKNGVTNHFGIVESVRDDGGYNTIEANTGNPTGIYRKVRYVERDGIEGFINPY